MLPDSLIEHAREFYASGAAPVVPRRAATVVLLRDTATGPEAYLLRRAATMAFASGMYAFPGGSVDPRDGTGGNSDVPGPVLRAAIRETEEETGVRLAADLLRPWARWITPEFEPRRYDTYFFVAALPAGPEPQDISGEADRTCWLRPADALSGGLPMLPPTATVLRDLSGYGSVAEILAVPRSPLSPVVPRLVFTDTGASLVLPDSPEPGALDSPQS
jgi:8-oxo-dGTP pyrophosphatase MutT (NUDIX family)